jgi:hypothetical protein
MEDHRQLLVPKSIKDTLRLSRLLDRSLHELGHSSLEMSMKSLAWDSQIPLEIWQRLRNLHQNPDDATNIEAKDFHIVFAEIKMRFPTMRMWELADGAIYFEM